MLQQRDAAACLEVEGAACTHCRKILYQLQPETAATAEGDGVVVVVVVEEEEEDEKEEEEEEEHLELRQRPKALIR